MRTRLVLLAVTVLILGVLVSPAAATPDEGDGHKVEVCHVTNSEAKPFVLIEVDFAAFDGLGANDHSHHVAKDDRVDVSPVNGSCPDNGNGGGG